MVAGGGQAFPDCSIRGSTGEPPADAGLCAESLAVFLASEGPRLEMNPRLVQSQEGCPWYGRHLGKAQTCWPAPSWLV